MITLKQWMELVDYKITEGSDYFVNVEGLYMLNSWNGEQDGFSLDIAFDPKDNQKVYLVEANDFKNNRAYRMKDSTLEVDNQAWDDVDYIDLETDDDFIEKALAIKSGKEYDTRIKVPVEFTDEELLRYMKIAHDLDITFNELMERSLREAIRNIERERDVIKGFE